MKTSVAQYIILGIFILFLITGVIIFAKFSGSNSSDVTATQASIWGTVPDTVFSRVVENINSQKQSVVNVAYREISADIFEQTLIEALADGTGPDAVIMPNTMLLKNQKKLSIIGYDVISERTFKDSFIQGAETLLTSKGTYGIPVFVDPLVMYWNRDILTSKNVARPPTTWEEVLALSDILTERRDDRSIIKSTVALGDYSNVGFAKDIIMALVMQAGGNFVIRNSSDGLLNVIATTVDNNVNPFGVAVTFFTQFSDPLKSIYTWNRSLPDSKQAFVNGDVAFYFGHASDAYDIRGKNPNLNFDVASLPQPKSATRSLTTGTVYSFSILASSQNKASAYSNISILTSAGGASVFANALGLPPARNDLLSVSSGTAFGDVFWKSALWTRSYLDPDPVKTNIILGNAVNSVVTGSSRANDVAGLVNRQIDELLR